MQRLPQANRSNHTRLTRHLTLAWIIALAILLTACGSSVAPSSWLSPTPTTPSRHWIMPTSAPDSMAQGQGATILPVEGVTVSILAGSGLRGGIDGPGREAQFDGPMALALDHEGYLLVAEYDSGRIRIVDNQGFCRSWVGEIHDTGVDSPSTGPFDHPTDLLVSEDGSRIYVLDNDGRLTAIVNRERLEYLAGGNVGFGDGPASEAAFRRPMRLAQGPAGVLYMTDSGNHRVRMYDPSGSVYTLAGSGAMGYVNESAASAQMAYPHGIAVGPQGQIYVGDGGGWSTTQTSLQASVRVLDSNGQLVTIAGGAKQGYVDGGAAKARFARPLAGMDVDSRGNLYIADTGNHAVRVLRPDGQVMTVAGTGAYGLREGQGKECMLGLPVDVLWDGETGLWVADYGQQVIWRIEMAGTTLFTD